MVPIEPLGNRVLLRPHKTDEVTSGGIALPDQARRSIPRATVIAVGPGESSSTTGERKKMSVQQGDVVMFTMQSGQEVEHDGEKYLLMDESYLLAIVRNGYHE